ncbi:MAG: flavodoxin family protein [Lachnotalea sp.]
MQYLVINGSPHKGNTWKVVKMVMEQLKKTDEQFQFQEIHLAELNLPFCTGCSNCFRLGYEVCPHSNRMIPIIDAMEKADGLIVASTTFFMRETGLLKNFMDHLTYMMHRPQFFTKKALVITTVGGVGGKAAAKSIVEFLKGIGYNKCYIKSVRSMSWNVYEPSQSQEESIQKCAAKFGRDVLSKKIHVQSTGLLIPYNIFRGMSIYYTAGTKYETEDGAYWTEEVRRKRVYDSNVPVMPHQIAVGSIFYLMGKVLGKRMIVTYKK